MISLFGALFFGLTVGLAALAVKPPQRPVIHRHEPIKERSARREARRRARFRVRATDASSRAGTSRQELKLKFGKKAEGLMRDALLEKLGAPR